MSTKKQRVLIQMSGTPGSGKSTLANLLQQSMDDALVIDHDIIRSSLLEDNNDVTNFDQVARTAYRLQWALAEQVVRQGKNLIIDSTCNYPRVLDQGCALAARHGLEYWYVECRVEDIGLLDQRLRSRVDPMRSQRTGVDRPPAAAVEARRGEDSEAWFRQRIENPCRPERNVVVVDSTGGALEAHRDSVLQQIFKL